MLPNLFAEPIILVSGLAAGFAIGFLLQKGRISQFQTIIGQFLLRDFTLAKMLLTAILVGSIGIHALLYLEAPAAFPVVPWSALATIIGALIMGVGITILGYCPGTCAAAAGQGSNDAWWGLLGMLLGGACYAEVHYLLKKNILATSIISEKTTLLKVFHVSPWVLIAIIAIIVMILFKVFEKGGVLPPKT